MAVYVKSAAASNSQLIAPSLPVLNTRRTSQNKYFSRAHDSLDERMGKRPKKKQNSEYYAVIRGFFLSVPTIFSSW
jgi:hypothetical protein